VGYYDKLGMEKTVTKNRRILTLESILDFGHYKGNTVIEVMEKDMEYIQWLHQKGLYTEFSMDVVKCLKQENPTQAKQYLINKNNTEKTPKEHYDLIDSRDAMPISHWYETHTEGNCRKTEFVYNGRWQWASYEQSHTGSWNWEIPSIYGDDAYPDYIQPTWYIPKEKMKRTNQGRTWYDASRSLTEGEEIRRQSWPKQERITMEIPYHNPNSKIVWKHPDHKNIYTPTYEDMTATDWEIYNAKRETND